MKVFGGTCGNFEIGGFGIIFVEIVEGDGPQMGMERTKKDRIVASIVSLLLATVVLVLALQIYHSESSLQSENLRTAAFLELAKAKDRLQTNLIATLQYAELIKILVIHQDGQITNEDFSRYAESVMKANKSITCIGLAPDGKRVYVYPTDSDTVNKTSFEHRVPILINRAGKVEYWGYSFLTFDFETLIAEADLKTLENSFYFALRTGNPEHLPNVVFWGNEELFSQDSFILPIQLPDVQWELAIYPQGGWNQKNPYSGEMIIALFLITVAFSVFSYQFIIRIRIRKRQAILDPLTKTASRSEFYRIFEELRRQRDRVNKGLLYIDLDDFKLINDTYGHQVGDMVLSKVGERMRDSIRKDDVISRYGGDEFVLLIRHIQNEQALHLVAERILTTIGSPITVGETELSIGASIGGIIFQDVDFDLDQLLGKVDRTMYDAKAAGKNQFKIAHVPISV